MSEARWSLQDAKNRFTTVVNAAAEGRPQTVTRRGKPVVVVLSVREFERLHQRDVGRAASFVDHLLAIPQDDMEAERVALVPRNVDF